MDRIKELENRIKALEDKQVSISHNDDVNILRAVERALLTNNLSIGQSNTPSANASAIMVLNSITKGFLIMRMTTAERDLIVNPVAGMIIYNTTTAVLNFHNGSVWGAV